MTPTPSKVPLPSPIDDKYLSMEGQGEIQSPGAVSPNQFLHENMKLIGILGHILSAVYHSTEPGSEVETQSSSEVDFQALMDIDRALCQFESELHPALHWDPQRVSNGDINPSSKRQGNVLHARYTFPIFCRFGKFTHIHQYRFLHLKLLLNRPAFTDYCSTTRANNTQDSVRSWTAICRANCAVMCVQAACDLVTSLAEATSQDATGAWWYGVFCKFCVWINAMIPLACH